MRFHALSFPARAAAFVAFAFPFCAEAALSQETTQSPVHPQQIPPRQRIESILGSPFRGAPDQQCLFFLEDHKAAVSEIGNDAVPFLIRGLRYRDPETRLKGVLCLTVLGGDAAPAVNALRPLLKTRTDRQAYWTIICLGDIGKASRPAVPDLLALLKHPQGRPFSELVGESIGRIATDSGKVPRELHDLLTEKRSVVKQSAVFALGECGSLAKPLVPKIIALLNDPGNAVRAEAARALGKIRQQPQLAIPALLKALDDPRPSVRLAAIEAIGEFGSQAAKAVPALIQQLRGANPRIRAAAATALGKIGPAATTAIPVLTEVLKDSDETVTQAAKEALDSIRKPEEPPK